MNDVSGKTFLLIVNSAMYTREYFTRLGEILEGKGARAVFVLDSHLSDVMSGENAAIAGGWYFTDFCKKWLQRPAQDRARSGDHGITWKSLLSDFDRFVTYRMTPPLKKSGSMSYEETLYALTDFFDTIFDEVKPDGVVYEQVSNSFAMAAYRTARRRGVPFFSVAPARIPGHIEISATGAFRDHETVGDLYQKVKRTGGDPAAQRVALDYIASIDGAVPDYMRKGGDGAVLMSTSLIEKYARRDKLTRLRRMIRYRRTHREDIALAYQFGDPLRASWALVRRAIARKLRFRAVARLFQDRVTATSYFLYPLHYHPEASTSILAADYIDEFSVIQAIAFRLPAHVKLVVKEHPSATALQPYAFYRALDALPNVELVGPGLNSKSLARSAIGVICLTSTLGFEAAALNKPVICLGDVLYGYFPNVRMIDSYADLDDVLAWAMAYTPIDPNDIADAMTAYVEFMDPGSFSFKGSLQDDSAIERVAELLLEKVVDPRTPAMAPVS